MTEKLIHFNKIIVEIEKDKKDEKIIEGND